MVTFSAVAAGAVWAPWPWSRAGTVCVFIRLPIVDRPERSGHVRRGRGAEDRRRIIIQAIWTPEHDQAAGGIFAPRVRAVEEDLAGSSEDQLALILEFMGRHAATLQRITIEVREADNGRSQ